MSVLAVLASPLAALAMAAAAPAHATPYPPAAPAAAVNRTVAPPGGTFVVTFHGFAAHERVSIDIHSATVHLATVTADASGAGSAQVVAPAGFSGTHAIVMTGLTSGMVASVEVAIAAAATISGSGLPNTGVEVRSSVLLAGVLLSSGLGFVLAARIRRRRRPAG